MTCDPADVSSRDVDFSKKGGVLMGFDVFAIDAETVLQGCSFGMQTFIKK